MSLRAKQAAARRSRILDATAKLVRDTGSTDFTMLDVAAAAEVSPATPYNLFGSKDGLLYASLNRSLDELLGTAVPFASKAAIEHPIAAGERATRIIVSDPVYFRPLFLVMLGVRDEVHRARFLDRSLDYWRRSLKALGKSGTLGPPIDLEDLARALLFQYIAVLGIWAHEDFDEEEFLAQVTYGIALQLLGLADESGRGLLLAHMRTAREKLPRGFSFAGPRAA